MRCYEIILTIWENLSYFLTPKFKPMVKKLFVLAVSIALFGACTQDELRNVDPIKDDQALTERSSAAECDSIETAIFPNPSCEDLATLLECRLNQGVDEELTTQCDNIDSYTFSSDCLTQDTIVNDWQTLQEDYRQRVNDNTDDCPPCVNPDPVTGCKTIVFTVTFTQDCTDPDDSCEYRIDAEVYCCE